MRNLDFHFGNVADLDAQTPDQRILRGGGRTLGHADRDLSSVFTFLRRRTSRPVGAYRRRQPLDLGLPLGNGLDAAHDLRRLLQRSAHRQAQVEVEFGLVDLGNQLGAQLG